MKLASSISLSKLGKRATTVEGFVDALVNCSRVIPPTTKLNDVLLSPHVLGTHVPLPVMMVVPGVASSDTADTTTAAANKKDY